MSMFYLIIFNYYYYIIFSFNCGADLNISVWNLRNINYIIIIIHVFVTVYYSVFEFGLTLKIMGFF